MANYCVLARFDEHTNDKLTSLRTRLYENGYINEVSAYPPHITIAAYENVDINELLEWTEEFANKHSSFDIALSSLGILPPGGEHTETAVLYASPSQAKDLIDFYFAFHDKLDDFCGKIGWWYSAKFGYPAIHSTIGVFEIVNMQKAIEFIFGQNIFGKAKIIALEVYTYPMELIKCFEMETKK